MKRGTRLTACACVRLRTGRDLTGLLAWRWRLHAHTPLDAALTDAILRSVPAPRAAQIDVSKHIKSAIVAMAQSHLGGDDLMAEIAEDLVTAIESVFNIRANMYVHFGFEGNMTSMSSHVRVSSRPPVSL